MKFTRLINRENRTVDNKAKYEEQIKILEEYDAAYGAWKRVNAYATMMDRAFIDPLLGVLTGGGDLLAAVHFLYTLVEGQNAKLPVNDRFQLFLKQVADFAVGLIPVAGDVGDAFYRSNVYAAKLFAKRVSELEELAVEVHGVPKDYFEVVKRTGMKYLYDKEKQPLDDKYYELVSMYGKDPLEISEAKIAETKPKALPILSAAFGGGLLVATLVLLFTAGGSWVWAPATAALPALGLSFWAFLSSQKIADGKINANLARAGAFLAGLSILTGFGYYIGYWIQSLF